MTKDDRFYVRHVLECIGRIEKYAGGVGPADFFAEELIQELQIRLL